MRTSCLQMKTQIAILLMKISTGAVWGLLYSMVTPVYMQSANRKWPFRRVLYICQDATIIDKDNSGAVEWAEGRPAEHFMKLKLVEIKLHYALKLKRSQKIKMSKSARVRWSRIIWQSNSHQNILLGQLSERQYLWNNCSIIFFNMPQFRTGEGVLMIGTKWSFISQPPYTIVKSCPDTCSLFVTSLGLLLLLRRLTTRTVRVVALVVVTQGSCGAHNRHKQLMNKYSLIQ